MRLRESVQYGELPDVIVLFDDLDCREYEKMYTRINAAVDSVPECRGIKRIAGFAAPEIESWIISMFAIQKRITLRS